MAVMLNPRMAGTTNGTVSVTTATQILLGAAFGQVVTPTNKPKLQQLPARSTPGTVTASTYYVDPSAAVHGSGTSNSPYKDLRDLPFPPVGCAVLFKEGTTFQPSGGYLDVILDVTGFTAGAAQPRTFFGVYNATTGARVTDGSKTATIDGQNTTSVVMNINHANSRWNVEIDGLTFIRGTGEYIRLVSGGGCRIANCHVDGATTNGIYSNGATASNTFENNTALNCGFAGIKEAMAANCSSSFNYNTICGLDLTGSFTFNGTSAGNTVIGVSGKTSNGINIQCAGGNFKVFRNNISKCQYGVAYFGVSATADLFTTAIIENNDITLCKFGVYANNVNGGYIQYNRIDKAGTFDGTTEWTTDHFGRGIEIYNLAGGTTSPKNVRVRGNIVTRVFSINTDGTEGVGIGLDNNATDCIVEDNFIQDCYGNGIQANRTTRCIVLNNTIVNCFSAPAGTFSAIVTTNGRIEGAIQYGVSPGFLASNNTIICSSGSYSRYGICELNYNTAGGSPGARLLGNRVLNAPISGILLDTTATKSTEDHNILENCTAAVLDGTGSAATAGNGTSSVASGVTGISSATASVVYWQTSDLI